VKLALLALADRVRRCRAASRERPWQWNAPGTMARRRFRTSTWLRDHRRLLERIVRRLPRRRGKVTEAVGDRAKVLFRKVDVGDGFTAVAHAYQNRRAAALPRLRKAQALALTTSSETIA